MKSRIELLLKKSSLVVSLLLIVAVAAMSVGYAAYSSEIKALGNVVVTFLTDNEVIIESIEQTDQKNASSSDNSFVNETKVWKSFLSSEISGTFSGGTDSYIELTYKITNISAKQQKFIEFVNYSSLGTGSYTMPEPRMLNLKLGDVLAPGESRDVKVIYYYKDVIDNPDIFTANNKFIFININEDAPIVTMTGTIQDNEFSVPKTEDTVSSKVNISNLFNVSVKYELRVSSSKITLVNSSGNTTNYGNILDSGENTEHNIYFKTNMNSGEEVTTDLYIYTESGDRYDISSLKFTKEGVSTIAPVTGETTRHGGYLQDEQNAIFYITNDTGHDITSWQLVIKFKDDAPIKAISNWSANRGQWDNTARTYTIAGIDRYNGNRDVTIANGTIKEVGEIGFTFDTNESKDIMEYIEYVAVEEGHANVNAIRDDKNCTGGTSRNNYKLTCLL